MLHKFIACLIAGSLCVASARAERPPNIVFIMVDDLGVGWVDLEGSDPRIQTPNLQRLAESGMVFTRAYAAATVCSPTRAACITGRAPARIGLTAHIPGRGEVQRHAPEGGPDDAPMVYHLPPELPSYARELKKQGYATGFIGKWHLAGAGSIHTPDGVVNAAWHPQHYGFDVNLGGCAYGQPKSWFDPYANGTLEDRKDGEYLTDRLGDEAAAFIHAHHEGPFHLTFWPYAVHTPIEAPAELVRKNDGDAFRAMLEAMDHAVGKILDALDKTGVADNTLVVFYSDNGGHFPTEGLAEKKASLLEGGVRVPMVVRWPKVIEPGSTCDVPVTSMDFFPTFVHAAGGNTAEHFPLDGLDLKPLFAGEPGLEREALYWHFPHNRTEVQYVMGGTILEGEWKFYKGYGVTSDALFNLRQDPTEQRNVVAAEPERADRLRGKLVDWLAAVDAKLPPGVTLESLRHPNTGPDVTAAVKTVRVRSSELQGIGAEPGVMRRDPSDVIQVGDLYYVWYSKGPISPGYDATVWYATSPDGRQWTERGEALAKGEAGSWDGASVFTPNILVAEDKYWLFYTGTSKPYERPFNPDSKIGLAVAESADGPWKRLDTNPILTNSERPEDFDSHLVDDACLIVREGRYWLYYKGRQLGKSPAETRMGLAIAEQPQGPYVKVDANPVIPGNHEVLVWPQGTGVAAMIGTTGPEDITESILYAEDGLHFEKTHDVVNAPHAAGAFRPEAFTDSGEGELPRWGVQIGRKSGFLPFIERIDFEEIEADGE